MSRRPNARISSCPPYIPSTVFQNFTGERNGLFSSVPCCKYSKYRKYLLTSMHFQVDIIDGGTPVWPDKTLDYVISPRKPEPHQILLSRVELSPAY